MATRETWKKRAEQWESSGLSAERFVVGRGFTAAALQTAVERLHRAPEVHLARVEIVPERVLVPDEVPVVLWAEAVRIEVTRGFSSETLAAVLDVLEGRR